MDSTNFKERSARTCRWLLLACVVSAACGAGACSSGEPVASNGHEIGGSKASADDDDTSGGSGEVGGSHSSEGAGGAAGRGGGAVRNGGGGNGTAGGGNGTKGAAGGAAGRSGAQAAGGLAGASNTKGDGGGKGGAAGAGTNADRGGNAAGGNNAGRGGNAAAGSNAGKGGSSAAGSNAGRGGSSAAGNNAAKGGDAAGTAGAGGAAKGGNAAAGGSSVQARDVPPGEVCARLSELQCEAEASCCDSPGRSVDDCKSAMAEKCAQVYLDEISQNSVSGYSAQTTGARLAEFQRLASTCDPAVVSWGVSPSGMRGIFPGTKGQGADCSPSNVLNAADAASYLMACKDPAQTACRPALLSWSCASRSGEGGACFTDANCQEDLYCDNPQLALVGATCKAKKADGDSCAAAGECVSLACKEGTCVPADAQSVYCLNGG